MCGKFIGHSTSVKSVCLTCFLLILPFLLAYLSWLLVPVLAECFVFDVLGYGLRAEPAHRLWRLTLGFFYAWYTFLTIGVGGVFILAAWLWRLGKKRAQAGKIGFYPMVSFIVPAYNEAEGISRCLKSLFDCVADYPCPVQIIVVDDGSDDLTYELAVATLEANRGAYPHVYGRVVRLTSNLGKAEAIRTGLNKAMGNVVAVVDADSWWEQKALVKLLSHMKSEGCTAITGYIHPSDGENQRNLYIILQQLEYSQGLGIFRSAEALGNAVMVIPGPMGLYEANVLRDILNERKMRSVTEDFEVTLELHKRKLKVGYIDTARGSTVAPYSLKELWEQRIRWFTGWIHNVLSIHRDMAFKRHRTALLLWYYMFLGYVGAAIEITSIFAIPFLFWFAPDRILFLPSFLIFGIYATFVGSLTQAIALKFAYNEFNHRRLLLYSPLYFPLRLVNAFARLVSLIKYLRGDKGKWRA